MCSKDNPNKIKYIFLTQEQYDSIDFNNEESEENKEKDGEGTNE